MQPVCSKYCYHLADFGVQIGIGAASGVFFAKIDPVINLFDGALIGSASGAISGVVGRIVLIYHPETGDDAMQKITDIALNGLLTVGFSMLAHFTCFALEHWGEMQVSIHDAT